MLERDIRDFFFQTRDNYRLAAVYKELSIDGLRIDLFAVDEEGNPFIIEFKKDQNRHIVGQSAHYLALIPAHHKRIEKKIRYFNINWANLKVLCVARSFSKRDVEALDFDPIKGRVFLYRYEVVKDYRGTGIFGLNLLQAGKGVSPLHIPPPVSNGLDLREQFGKLAIKGKENQRQYYTNTILPLLQNVSHKLKEKYESKGLYPHLSYFQGGFIILRLGIGKKQSHRASVAISFTSEGISSGFDLTHALPDAQKLSGYLKAKISKIAIAFLSLTSYSLYLPNTGIWQSLAIDQLDEKGMRLLLLSYEPTAMRDCYFRIFRPYTSASLTAEGLLKLVEEEFRTFWFLLKEIQTEVL